MSRKLVILAILLLSACGSRSPEEHLEYARLQRAKGKLADAIESFRAAAELLPGRVDVRVELAQVHLDRRDAEAARRVCAEALALDPSNTGAHEAKIRSYVIEERFEDAYQAGEEYLEVATEPARALVTVATLRKEQCTALLISLVEESRSCPDVRDEPRLLLEIGRGDLSSVERLLRSWGETERIRALLSILARADAVRSEAVSLADRAVTTEPGSGAAHALRGELALLAGHPAAAIADLTRAAAEDVDEEVREKALTHLVAAREALGEPEAALAAIESAVKLNPGDEPTRLSRALLRIRTGDLEGALRDADTLEKQDAASVLDDYVRGVVHMSRGEYQKAHEDLVRATTIPGDPGPHFWLGLALLAQGQRQVGVASLKDALERQPNDTMAHVALSFATLDGGRAAEALDHAERATEIDPDSPAAWNALARACLARSEEFAGEPGRRRELRLRAEHAVQRLSALQPGWNGEGALALLRLTRGGTEEAVVTVLDGLEDRPEDPELLLLLGYIHSRRGEPDLARAAFEKVKGLAPERSEPWLGLAGVERATGNLAGAEEVLRELIGKMPETAAARLAIAELVPPGEAEKILTEGIRLDPEDADLHFLLLEVRRALGDEDAVLAAAREAARLVPGDPRLIQVPLLEVDAGNSGEALRLAEEMSGRFPDAPLAWAALAVSHAAGGSSEAAVNAAAKARELSMNSPWTLVLLADMNTLAGDVDRARTLIENARVLAPSVRDLVAAAVPESTVPARAARAASARIRAIGWFLSGRWPERAARGAAEALAVQPDDPICLEILAVSRTRIRDFEGARVACRRLLELDPGLTVARVRIAESLLAEGRKDEARAELETALEEGLEDVRGLFLLARLRTDGGDRDAALKAAVLAARGAKEDPEALTLLAAFQEDAGDLEAALRTLERAHVIAPEFPGVKTGLSRVLTFLGRDVDRAEELAAEAANLAPRWPRTFHTLALARLRAGRPEDALRAIEDAVARSPDDPSFRATRGEILLALGRADEAKADLLRAESEGPEGARVDLALALIAHRNGDLEEATRRYEAILGGNVRSFQAANNLACIYLETGESPERAMALAESAVEMGGRTPATLDTLAWAALENGDPALAVRLLTEALGLAPGTPALEARLAEARSALE